MECLSLPFLRQVIDRRVTRVRPRLLQTNAAHASVFRVSLAYANGRGAVRSVIVKSIEPDWPGDEAGADREILFYKRLLPDLELPKPQVLFAGQGPASGGRILVLEDLEPRFNFYPATHAWTRAEAERMLPLYARLHATGVDHVPSERDRDWLARRHESRWTPDTTLRQAQALTESGAWGTIPGLDRLLDCIWDLTEAYLSLAPTILHNDLYPSNIGFSRDGSGQAILIDWGLAGWGLPEMDLAYMALQPYRADRLLDRAWALEVYWQERKKLEGMLPPAEERRERQRYADALLAITEIPVAYRVTASPFPEGSYPERYWKAMFPVLHTRLQELSRGWR